MAVPEVFPQFSDAIQGEIKKLGEVAKLVYPVVDVFKKLGEVTKPLGELSNKATAGFKALGSIFASLRGEMLGVVVGVGASIAGIAALVNAADPAQFVLFTQATRSLAATLGQILDPVLVFVTKAIKGLADVLVNLSPTLKAVIAGMAVAGIAFAVFSAAITAAVTVMTAAFTALDVASGGVLAAIGLAVTAGAALAAGLAAAGISLGAFTGAGEKLADALAPLKGLFDDLLDVLESSLDNVLEPLADLFDVVAAAVKELWEILKPLENEFYRLAKALGSIPGEILKGMVAAFREMGTALQALMPLIEAFVTGLSQMVDGMVTAIVVAGTLARRAFDPKALLDFDGIIAEVIAKLDKLNERRKRDLNAPQPLTARHSTAEEFGREAQRMAFQAVFTGAKKGDKKADPAALAAEAAKQREDMIRRLTEIAETNAIISGTAVNLPGETAAKTGNAVLEGLERAFAPIFGYLRRVGAV